MGIWIRTQAPTRLKKIVTVWSDALTVKGLTTSGKIVVLGLYDSEVDAKEVLNRIQKAKEKHPKIILQMPPAERFNVVGIEIQGSEQKVHMAEDLLSRIDELEFCIRRKNKTETLFVWFELGESPSFTITPDVATTRNIWEFALSLFETEKKRLEKKLEEI